MKNSIYEKVLDEIKNGDVALLGARPGVGKTTFSIGLADEAINMGKKIYLFSLDMSYEQVVIKFLNQKTGNSYPLYQEYSKGEDAFFKKNFEKLYGESILIDDEVNSIEMIERKITSQKDLGFVLIDYLGLIKCEEKLENRVQEVEHIMERLKNIAKKCNVPIICCVQVARSAESRMDHRPRIDDIRDVSGDNADVIFFLYREAYYRNEKPDYDPTLAELIIAKNKNGDCGTYQMRWNNNKFIDKD